MFLFKKKKRTVAIEVNDYYIRALRFVNKDLSEMVIQEYPLPSGIVEEEVIKDEMEFYSILKTIVKEWGIAKHDVRFFVPDHAILMREIPHPPELDIEGIKTYAETEIGNSIHLPFEQPLIDIYDTDPDDEKAMLFAAPSEDIMELIHLFEEVKLEPAILDVRALSNIRFLQEIEMINEDKTYLIAEWSVNSVSICIYAEGAVNFMRYQPIETQSRNWRYIPLENGRNGFVYEGEIEAYRMPLTDQVMELERILNFYRYSLYKGEKMVDELIMMGNNPELPYIVEQTQAGLTLPIRIITGETMQKYNEHCRAGDTALIGLSLRGER